MMKEKIVWLLVVTSVLASCASAPRNKETQQGAAPIIESSSGPSNGGSRSSAGSLPVTQQSTINGGGYLPGDGPGADVPSNLDSIPDAVPRAEPLHRYANRPYTALGKTYTPLTVTGKYKERGIASWYGKKFHGQNTSIGEVYDMYGMSAAHPTLPIPSYARVTNVSNGKSVVVRVNDRGPFLHDRIMDLSYAAAYKLGIINNGSGEVEVESIAVDAGMPISAPAALTSEPLQAEPLPASVPVANARATAGKIYLQLGAFKSKQGAASFLAKLRSELGELGKPLGLFDKDGLTRVHLGPYRTQGEARNQAEQLKGRLGFKPFVSVH